MPATPAPAAAVHRRICRAVAVIAVALIAVASARPASAMIEIDVTRGNVQPLPIALPGFVGAGADAKLGADITDVIASDLKRSGLFLPLDPSTFVQKAISPDETPRFADWRVINAQALVTGGIARQPDGRLRAEFRLWDVFATQQIAGQQFFTTPDNWRRVAHIIADAIYQRLTGEKGYFDTRVVFVAESGPKDNRVKRLAIMDQDGANVRYLTDGKDLVLTPRLQSERAGNHLHVVSRHGAAARLPAQHRDRAARTGRRFPRHDLRTALLARRAEGDHEPAAGQQRQHLRDGPALEAHDAADRRRRHRHQPVLFARRLARSCSPPTAAARRSST